MTGNEGESSTAASATGSSSDTESSTGAIPSTADGTTDPVTSADTVADTSIGGSDGSSESSSGGDACACDGAEILCESFEPPFDLGAPPWARIFGSGSIQPELTDDPTVCGTQSLRTAVEAGDLYSVINAGVGSEIAEPGAHRLRTSLWVSSGCDAATTRVMLVKFPMGAGNIVYHFAVWIGPEGIELRMENRNSDKLWEPSGATLSAEQWHDIELDFDVVSHPPRASVRVDGDLVLEDIEGPDTAAPVVFEAMQSINLGIYRADVAFEQACTVVYDEVRIITL